MLWTVFFHFYQNSFMQVAISKDISLTLEAYHSDGSDNMKPVLNWNSIPIPLWHILAVASCHLLLPTTHVYPFWLNSYSFTHSLFPHTTYLSFLLYSSSSFSFISCRCQYNMFCIASNMSARNAILELPRVLCSPLGIILGYWTISTLSMSSKWNT